jgi:hypothetical protein
LELEFMNLIGFYHEEEALRTLITFCPDDRKQTGCTVQ